MNLQPVSATSLIPDEPVPTPWSLARERLAGARTYWLATSCPNGRPHAVPVLAVWSRDALYFAAGAATRKARNLANDPRCSLSASGDGADLVVEGVARVVTDDATLQPVVDAYADKYGWRVTIRDGAIDGDGAPTAGPPPYHVYELTPSTAFGFGTDGSFVSTRWRFA